MFALVPRSAGLERAEVAKLVGVGDRSHRLDLVVRDVERDDHRHSATWAEEHRARLAADRDGEDPGDIHATAVRGWPAEQARDLVASGARTRERRSRATAVGVDDHVGGEQLDQAGLVLPEDRIEEPLRELVPPARARP